MDSEVVVMLNSGDDALQKKCEAISSRIRVLRRPQLEADPGLLASAEVIYGWLSPEKWTQASRLRWLQLTGAGANGLLTPVVRASSATITNVSGIHAAPITEHMFGMLLAYTRRLYQARDQQKEARWDSGPLGKELPILEGKTLGLLGVGAIGGHSARVGRGFGMRTIGYRRTRDSHPHLDSVYGPGELIPFLAESDVVMNSLPLTDETRHLLGAAELAAMKEGSVLINTGRGATINTRALVEALEGGRPAAALLDVTDPEPLPAVHPLWQMDNVVITPHYSGSHASYSQRAERIFLQNLEHYIQGSPLINVVDKELGY